MAANSIPTAKSFPKRHNAREAKVIETALAGSGTISNKTIDSSCTVSGAIVSAPVVNGVVASVATGSLTAAQVIAATTAHDLLAAPGAGKINIVKSIEFFLDYAAAFTSGDDFTVEYAGSSVIGTCDKTSLLGTADLNFLVGVTGYSLSSATVAGLSLTANANKKIQFKVASAAFADGAGTVLKYKIHYETHTLVS